MEDLLDNLSSNYSNKNSSFSNCKELIEDAEYYENKSSKSNIYDINDNYLSSIKNDTSESQSFIQGTLFSSMNFSISSSDHPSTDDESSIPFSAAKASIT